MKLLTNPPLSQAAGMVILRLTLCTLVFIHGYWRATKGGVAPFGEWLTSQGTPFGAEAAIAVTGYELIAAPTLALGLFRPILATIFAAIYAAGMVMVHLPFGWFVVGAGRNGMEYSALLIICFLLVGWTRGAK
ncbi:MAG: DoxX family protein [Parvularculaceae bacterium]|nr:DoxX family protein [Parvularculaceae bacterium]